MYLTKIKIATIFAPTLTRSPAPRTWVPHVRDGFIVANVGLFSTSAIPEAHVDFRLNEDIYSCSRREKTGSEM